MKFFSMLVLIMIFAGCSNSGPDVTGYRTNKMINLLMNEKERSIFLVGNEYTYIYQDKPENTENLKGEYHAVHKLISILRNSRGFTFVKGPKVFTREVRMLDGTEEIDSDIEFTIDLKPSPEQVAYFNTLKENAGNRVNNIRIDNHSRRTLSLSIKKTCFLVICDNRNIEYTLRYHGKRITTIKTTEQMKQLPSKLNKNIVANAYVRVNHEQTPEEMEKMRQENKRKMIKRRKRNDSTKNISLAAGMLPIIIVAMPIALAVSIVK